MRSCIFCENRATSKEDAWPQWLIRLIGANKSGVMEGQRGKEEQKTWGQSGAEIRVGIVCGNCNNGWMNDLENRVKPIIEKFFVQERITLQYCDQETLAIWACKNAMVLEGTRQKTSWFYEKSEHWDMRKSLKIPSQTSIWIAKYVGQACPYSYALNLDGVAKGTNSKARAYVTTMNFGLLAFQIMSIKLPNINSQNISITPDLHPGPWEWKKIAVQIWPVQLEHVDWPASMGISNEEGLNIFSKRWSPTNS